MLAALLPIFVSVLLLIGVVWAFARYNGLVRARKRVEEAWSGIDVQLRRRASLLPNLEEVVKGYAAHEREVFIAVAENYPQLRASESFIALRSDLSEIEEKIAFARQFYNRNVLDYNTRLETFPDTIIASNCDFAAAEFFEAESEARSEVRMTFTRQPAAENVAPPPA